MPGSSVPLAASMLPIPFPGFFLLQAFPLSLSRKGIPREIPEAAFSLLHQPSFFFSSLSETPKRAVGVGVGCEGAVSPALLWKLDKA